LRLSRPIAVVRGDRCIVRQPSPSQTIGGGRVVDAHPPRHRRFRPEVVTGLDLLASGTPADLLLQALGDGPPLEWLALLKASGLADAAARAALAALVEQGQALALGAGSPHRRGDAEDREAGAEAHHPPSSILHPPLAVQSVAAWNQLARRLAEALRRYHRRYPLRRGMPREELRQRLKLGARAAEAALAQAVAERIAEADETSARLAGFEPTPTAEQRRSADAFLAACERAPFSPPPPALDPEVLGWLIDRGALVRVNDEVCFPASAYADLLAWVRATIVEQGSVTVAQLRDRFGSSRKYGLALLEHLDERKITRREGEGRVLY
jgi:selenocysteine-specific elongation factor